MIGEFCKLTYHDIIYILYIYIHVHGGSACRTKVDELNKPLEPAYDYEVSQVVLL